nr:pectate lyase [uncultured Pseudomonas sp.]
MELRFQINVRPDAFSPQTDSPSDHKSNSRTNTGDALGGRSFEEFAEQMAMALVAELLKGNPLLQQLLGGGNDRGEEYIGGGGGGGGQGLGQDFGSRFKEALFSYLDQLLGGSKEKQNVQGKPGHDGARESNWPNSASQFLRGGATSLLNDSIAPTGDGGGQVQNKEVLAPITSLMDKHSDVFGKPNPQSNTPGTTPVEPFGKPVSLSQVPSTETPASGPSKSAPPSVASTRTEGNFVFTKLAEGGIGGSSGIDFPKASANPNVVNEPIVVKKGEVFDGKGQTFTAGSKLGDGGQREDQLPLFILEDGASLKNVVIGDNGADGVHVHGDAKVDNVHWTNVGEDALTVKPNKEGKKANVEITNSSAQGANDKIFQLNADANLSIDNFKAKDFGTFLRTNGGQQGDWNIDLKNITAEDGKYKFVNSDAEGVKLSADNIRLQNVAEHIRLSKSSTLNLG